MLAPNGRDLANNCLVQMLERVYDIYVLYEAGSVSALRSASSTKLQGMAGLCRHYIN